jgi:YebC/PmpR family DNA-binding regulatory protein
MAGHNKWKQIKDKKAKTDGQKAKVFSKFARLITMEAKKAKGDKNTPGVRTAIERARAENVTNDVIDRAVKKATEAGGTEMESIVYESYGPGGCALVISALTDNRNKAAQEVKHILSKNGYELASIGSASWAFKKTGDRFEATTMVPISEADGALLQTLIEELEDNDEVQEVFTNAE